MNESSELRFTLLMCAILTITAMVFSHFTQSDRELNIDEIVPLYEDVKFVEVCKGIC